MSVNKKRASFVTIAIIIVVGVCIALAARFAPKNNAMEVNIEDNNNSAPDLESLGDLSNKSVEELSQKLSEIMLPEDEFLKLESAIFQTAMGLLMAQAQQDNLEVTDVAQQELKSNLDGKYSRKYFSNMNASSMQELSKEDLAAILTFYHTQAGQKFLQLSPKIIQTTMKAVQTDLSTWLPEQVNQVLAKLRNEPSPKDQQNKKPAKADAHNGDNS